MSQNENSSEWGKEMDAAEHEKTYAQFIEWSKWGTIGVCALVLWLILFVFS